MTSHTPGPWTIRTVNNNRFVGIFAGLGSVARLSASLDREANAHLIAAAPKLLEACKQALIVIDSLPNEGSVSVVLERAIAEAEGRLRAGGAA